MRAEAKIVRNYMWEVNERLHTMWGPTSKRDLVEVVPVSVMQQDEQFYNYIIESNET